MATLYKMVNGERIELSAEETKAREAEEKAWSDGAFDRAIASLREERNNKLSESDWMANSDVTMSSNWKTYRQELRDMTEGLDTIDKINNVTWPTEPS